MSKYRNNENIDYINQEIIKMLSLDGRMAYSEIAKELKISNSLVHQRIKKLQDTDYKDFQSSQCQKKLRNDYL
jgi:Lrp/AsnC family transcriptional regulator for asnA, asnC and gidA